MIIAQCPVCQELLESGDEDHLSALPCGHIFHCVCIDTWLKNASTCPQCRIGVNKRHIVKRIYFSLIDRASTSILLPELGQTSSQLDSDPSTKPCISSGPSGDTLAVGIALKTARSEIKQLMNQVASLQTEATSFRSKYAEKIEEVRYLKCLYKEMDKLYSVEKRKSRWAKLDLFSYTIMLDEAETAKSESLRLRKEMAEMRDIQTLIGASKKTATDLLNRYTDEQGSSPSSSLKESLKEVCRWAAVLRSELSKARKKGAKYRAETHRLQRLQARASKRVLAAEASAAEQKVRVNQLQAEITTLLTNKSCTTIEVSPPLHSPSLQSVQNVTPSLLANSSTSTDEMGIKTCLKFIDLSTSELDDLGLSSDLKIDKHSPITPRVNPFKLDASHTATPSSGRCQSDQPSSSATVAKPTVPETQSASSAPAGRHYNGMGGHETSSGLTSIHCQYSSTRTVKSNSKKHSLHSNQNVGKPKTMKLDAFYQKH